MLKIMIVDDEIMAIKTLKVKLSHQEIANDLLKSREVISRLLKKMEQNGLLELHRNHISLKKFSFICLFFLVLFNGPMELIT